MDRREFIRNFSVLAAVLPLIPAAVECLVPAKTNPPTATEALTEHEFYEWMESVFEYEADKKPPMIHCSSEIMEYYVEELGVPRDVFRVVEINRRPSREWVRFWETGKPIFNG